CPVCRRLISSTASSGVAPSYWTSGDRSQVAELSRGELQRQFLNRNVLQPVFGLVRGDSSSLVSPCSGDGIVVHPSRRSWQSSRPTRIFGTVSTPFVPMRRG